MDKGEKKMAVIAKLKGKKMVCGTEKPLDGTILQVEAAGATSSVSGNNVTLTFPATAECPMMVGLHLNGAAKQVEEVQLDSYDYSVN